MLVDPFNLVGKHYSTVSLAVVVNHAAAVADDRPLLKSDGYTWMSYASPRNRRLPGGFAIYLWKYTSGTKFLPETPRLICISDPRSVGAAAAPEWWA